MSSRMMRLHTLAPLLGCGFVVVLACSSSTAPGPGCSFDDDASAGVQGELFAVLGDGATAQAGAQIFLSARLYGVHNHNLCQKTITWTPAANSGSVSSGQSITDDIGAAGSVWTLGPATGTQTVTATVENSDPTLSVDFTATVTAPGVYRLEIVSGDQQTALPQTAVSEPLVVQFVDVNGDPAPATALTWVPSTGTLGQPTTTTDPATGLSQNTWILGVGDAHGVTVSEPGGSSVVFIATSTPNAYQLVMVSGNNQVGVPGQDLPQPLVVKLLNGNTPVHGVQLNWRITAGGSTLATYATFTDANGLSQNIWHLASAGLQQVSVSLEPQFGGTGVFFTATGAYPHPKAEIRAYNGTDTPGITVSVQTPYDGIRSLGPIAPGFSFPDSVQVELGAQFTISSTIGGQTGTVTCTTTTAIIPVPGDPMTGNAIVTVVLGAGGQPILNCGTQGWH
ncbi:MAG TPA: hypothetical protein VH438_06165 [Gemmatimonadales bacterium]